MSLPYNPDTHDEYNRLLREYQDAKEAYEHDDSTENWDRMQEALKRLNKFTAVMDMKRR